MYWINKRTKDKPYIDYEDMLGVDLTAKDIAGLTLFSVCTTENTYEIFMGVGLRMTDVREAIGELEDENPFISYRTESITPLFKGNHAWTL